MKNININKSKGVRVFIVLFLLLVLVIILNPIITNLVLQFRYNKWLTGIPQELARSDFVSVVVLSEQKNYIFKDNKFFKRYTVATGAKDRYPEDRTLREGVWRLGKRLDRRLRPDLDPMYGSRLIFMDYYNQFKKEFVQTKKAFHGTDEPEILGRPLSQGCVYHSNRDIVELYNLLPDNTLVITIKK